jgi:hypothetical protein
VTKFSVVTTWVNGNDFYARTDVFDSYDEACLARARIRQGFGLPEGAEDVDVVLSECQTRAAA